MIPRIALALAVVLGGYSCIGGGHPGIGATPTPAPLHGQLTRDDMQPVINAVQVNPDNFAGVWWEPTGWPLHIMIASDSPQNRAQVEQWAPAGAPIAWHPVRFSYSELDTIQEELVRRWNADLAGHGSIQMQTVLIDVQRNIVTVGLIAHAPAFEQQLRQRHREAIEFVIEPPSRPLICDFPVSDSTPDFCL